MKQGDLVLVPFPFSDLSAKKTRPAVIISNSKLGGRDVIVVGITSNKSGKHEVLIDSQDLERGALPLRSYVRVSKIVSLEKKIVRKVVGRLSVAKQKEVFSALSQIIQ